MPWLVVVDEECMELLDAAAEMAAAALAARSRRVDQDGVLKRSADMSRIKLATLRASMHQPPLREFHELPPDDVVSVHNLLDLFRNAQSLGERDAIWKTLRAYMLRPGTKKPFSGGSQPWSDEDLSKPRVAEDTASDAQGSSPVRKPVRKPRKRGAPQKASQ